MIECLSRPADGRIMCCICFDYFTVEELAFDEMLRPIDLCVPCYAEEAMIANSPRTPRLITGLAKILRRGRAASNAKLNRVINKHLRPDERALPLRHRLWLWHLFRVQHDLGPIFWCLARIWWIPGFRWLWQLRCRNVSFRMEAHNRRVMRKTKVVQYDWSGAVL